jgi:hypothetical protein
MALALEEGVHTSLDNEATEGLPMLARLKRFVLTPTSAGAEIDATGRIEVRTQRGARHFEAGVDAAVADGTTFIVLANGQPAGTITLADGGGDLHVSSLDGILPNGILPFAALGSIEVVDGQGTVLLVGRP